MSLRSLITNSEIDDEWITISEETITEEFIGNELSELNDSTNSTSEIQSVSFNAFTPLQLFDIEFDFCAAPVEFIREQDANECNFSTIVIKTSHCSKLAFLVDKNNLIPHSSLLKKELSVPHNNYIIINYATNLNLATFLEWVIDDVSPLEPSNVRGHLQLALQLRLTDKVEKCIEFWERVLAVFLNDTAKKELEAIKSVIISKSLLCGPYPFLFYIVQDYFAHSYKLRNNFPLHSNEIEVSQSDTLLLPVLLHPIKDSSVKRRINIPSYEVQKPPSPSFTSNIKERPSLTKTSLRIKGLRKALEIFNLNKPH